LTEYGDIAQHPAARLPERGSDIFVLPGRVRGASLPPRDARQARKSSLTGVKHLGENYDLTAQSPQIHRSTLRYRLARIRDITGRDLQNVDTRLNLHLATRVLDVLGGTDSTKDGHR
jgi:PucR C-terminal helix-turn-helix domain